MRRTISFYWMFMRLADGCDPGTFVRAFVRAWDRSARPVFRWKWGNAKARLLPEDPGEIVRFPEGSRQVVRFVGVGERGLLDLEGHPAGDTLTWEYPYAAIRHREAGYTTDAIASLIGELGDTGSLREALVALPEVQFSERLKQYRRAHGLDSSRDWLAQVNWIDFIPTSRLLEVGGAKGLQASGLVVLREGVGGLVVASDPLPPTLESLDDTIGRVIEISSTLWRTRIRNSGGKMPPRWR